MMRLPVSVPAPRSFARDANGLKYHGSVAIDGVFDPLSDATCRNEPGLTSQRMISTHSERSLNLREALIRVEDDSVVTAL